MAGPLDVQGMDAAWCRWVAPAHRPPRRQDAVKRNAALRQLLERHPNAS